MTATPSPFGKAGRRLAQGIVAQLLSLAARVVAQLATLPVMFYFWPTELVGRWMLLFALPAYLSIVALSFAGVGGNEALAAVAAGRGEEARTHFRVSWAISTLSILVLALAALIVAALVPEADVASLAGVAAGELGPVLAGLVLYVLGSAQVAVLAIPYRAVGQYPRHTLLAGLSVLADIPVIALAVAAGQEFAPLALALAAVRWIFVALLAWDARQRAPVFFTRDRISEAGRSLARLWRPSLAFMVMPVIFALNLQGYVLLIGAQFGPALLAGFVATRTLTRMIELVNNLSFSLQYYEAGYLGADKQAIQRRQLASATVITMLVVGLFAAVLLALGGPIQGLFTAGKTIFDPTLACVLLLAMLLRALATAPEAIIAAENRHAPLVAIYLAGSLAALTLAAILARSGASLTVVAGMVVLAEASQAIPGMAAALRHLGLSPREFLRSLASRERIDDIRALMRLLRDRV